MVSLKVKSWGLGLYAGVDRVLVYKQNAKYGML